MKEVEPIELEVKKYSKWQYAKGILIFAVFLYGCYNVTLDLISIFV